MPVFCICECDCQQPICIGQISPKYLGDGLSVRCMWPVAGDQERELGFQWLQAFNAQLRFLTQQEVMCAVLITCLLLQSLLSKLWSLMSPQDICLTHIELSSIDVFDEVSWSSLAGLFRKIYSTSYLTFKVYDLRIFSRSLSKYCPAELIIRHFLEGNHWCKRYWPLYIFRHKCSCSHHVYFFSSSCCRKSRLPRHHPRSCLSCVRLSWCQFRYAYW